MRDLTYEATFPFKIGSGVFEIRRSVLSIYVILVVVLVVLAVAAEEEVQVA